MVNFYEMLEVSENASQEIIEKAYKVLAKKYHPDVQEPQNRPAAETKMKQINEAYEILSDQEKRQQYDEELKIERWQKEQKRIQEEANRKMKQAQKAKIEQDTTKEVTIKSSVTQENASSYVTQEEAKRYQRKMQKEQENYQKKLQEEMNEQYTQLYHHYLRQLGYRVKEKWTWKRVKDVLKTLAILAVVLLLIWLFPPTHNWLVSFYENNVIIKQIVDVIGRIFGAIGNLFTHPPTI